jgi:hypothetical protein
MLPCERQRKAAFREQPRCQAPDNANSYGFQKASRFGRTFPKQGKRRIRGRYAGRYLTRYNEKASSSHRFLSWLRSRGSTKRPASRLTCIEKVQAVSGKDQLLDLAVLSGVPCRMTLQTASHSTKALRMLPNAARTQTMAAWRLCQSFGSGETIPRAYGF